MQRKEKSCIPFLTTKTGLDDGSPITLEVGVQEKPTGRQMGNTVSCVTNTTKPASGAVRPSDRHPGTDFSSLSRTRFLFFCELPRSFALYYCLSPLSLFVLYNLDDFLWLISDYCCSTRSFSSLLLISFPF